MKSKSVNYKELLLHWVIGLFMVMNLFSLSAPDNVGYSDNSIPFATEKSIANQNGSKEHRIFYKSFIEKTRQTYFKSPLLKDVFENLLVFKNRMVHMEFNANSLLVLFINFLIGTTFVVVFLFYPAAQKTSLLA